MRIENAKIIHADLLLDDHGMLLPAISIRGQSIGGVFGAKIIGKQTYDIYCRPKYVVHSQGIPFIMTLMKLFEVESFTNLNNQYIRIKIKDNEIIAIGNVMKDEWLNINEFFKKGEYYESV